MRCADAEADTGRDEWSGGIRNDDDNDGRCAKSVKVDYARMDREPPGPMYIIQAEVRIKLL